MADAMCLTDHDRIQVAVVGSVIGDESGFGVLRELHLRRPRLRLVAYSDHAGDFYVNHCVRIGAHGFVCSTDPCIQIIEVIRAVLGGKMCIPDRVDGTLPSTSEEHAIPLPIGLLSRGEFEVFDMIGRAMTSAQIAAALHRSPKTVESYRARIKKKLSLKTGVSLARMAFEYQSFATARIGEPFPTIYKSTETKDLTTTHKNHDRAGGA